MPQDPRSKLEDIALDLVTEVGPRGFTMAELSRRAGLSVAAPYRHFADRQELLEALALRIVGLQRQRYLDAMAAEPTPRGKLVAFAVETVRFAANDGQVFDPMLPLQLTPDTPAIVELRTDVTLELLAAASHFASDQNAQLDLLVRLSAATYGLASLYREGALPEEQRSVAIIEAQAVRLADAILQERAPL